MVYKKAAESRVALADKSGEYIFSGDRIFGYISSRGCIIREGPSYKRT